VNRCLIFTWLGIRLCPVLGTQLSFGQTNSAPGAKKVHPLPQSSDTSKSVAAFYGKKPLSVLSLTNRVSQDTILAITDPVNAKYDIDGYRDGYCGFGARLGRHYLGSGSLATVSFRWDQNVKRTVISLYGTNAAVGAAWQRDMANALRQTLGQESVLYDLAK
jgi:hypothetical protein